jgi:hypothetical protein
VTPRSPVRGHKHFARTYCLSPFFMHVSVKLRSPPIRIEGGPRSKLCTHNQAILYEKCVPSGTWDTRAARCVVPTVELMPAEPLVSSWARLSTTDHLISKGRTHEFHIIILYLAKRDEKTCDCVLLGPARHTLSKLRLVSSTRMLEQCLELHHDHSLPLSS